MLQLKNSYFCLLNIIGLQSGGQKPTLVNSAVCKMIAFAGVAKQCILPRQSLLARARLSKLIGFELAAGQTLNL